MRPLAKVKLPRETQKSCINSNRILENIRNKDLESIMDAKIELEIEPESLNSRHAVSCFIVKP